MGEQQAFTPCQTGQVDERKDSVRVRFGLSFSSKVVVYGHCLVSLTPTIIEVLTCLTPLPIFIQNHSGGDIIAIGQSPPSIHLHHDPRVQPYEATAEVKPNE